MYTLALCGLLIPGAAIGPSVKTYKGKALDAADVFDAAGELAKLPGEDVAITATPTDNWLRWDDDGKFPLKDIDLLWARVNFLVTKPQKERLNLYIIDCGSEKDAKKYFTQLRILRCPNYARSGKYLIKGSEPLALKWFTKHYGGERCDLPETAPKDKKP